MYWSKAKYIQHYTSSLSAVYHTRWHSIACTLPLPCRYLLTTATLQMSRWLSCGQCRLLSYRYLYWVSQRKKYPPITLLSNICKYRPVPNNPNTYIVLTLTWFCVAGACCRNTIGELQHFVCWRNFSATQLLLAFNRTLYNTDVTVGSVRRICWASCGSQ